MQPIDIPMLLDVFNNMKGRVTYHSVGMEGKASPLDCDSSAISRLDCSGFSQYAIAKSANQQVIIPAGSSDQHDWCAAQGLYQLAQYSDVQYAAADSTRLFIAFIPPSNAEHHVWLIYQGNTMECCSSRGVCTRSWDTPILTSNVWAAFELPCVNGAGCPAPTN